MNGFGTAKSKKGPDDDDVAAFGAEFDYDADHVSDDTLAVEKACAGPHLARHSGLGQLCTGS